MSCATMGLFLVSKPRSLNSIKNELGRISKSISYRINATKFSKYKPMERG